VSVVAGATGAIYEERIPNSPREVYNMTRTLDNKSSWSQESSEVARRCSSGPYLKLDAAANFKCTATVSVWSGEASVVGIPSCLRVVT